MERRYFVFFFFSSRRRHTRFSRDWSSDVCSSDLSSHRSWRVPRWRQRPARRPSCVEGDSMSVESLDRLVRQVAAQVRWRRVEHYGLRGAFYGALASVAVLIFKLSLGPLAVPAALALFFAGALAGAVLGLAKSVPTSDAARLADRAFGLDDRVATALEWGSRSDRTSLVDALVGDPVERTSGLTMRQVVRRRASRE